MTERQRVGHLANVQAPQRLVSIGAQLFHAAFPAAPLDCLGCNRSYPGNGSQHAATCGQPTHQRRYVATAGFTLRYIFQALSGLKRVFFVSREFIAPPSTGGFYTNPHQPKTQPPFGLGCHVSHAPCSASIPALDCGIAGGLARPLHILAAFLPAAHGRFVSRWVPKRHCAEGISKLALPRHRARIGFGPRPFPLSGYLLCARHASVWPQRAARGPPSCDVQAGRCGATTQTPRSATVALAAMRRCDLFSHTFCGLMEAAGTVGTVCTSLFRSSRKVIPWNFSSRRA